MKAHRIVFRRYSESGHSDVMRIWQWAACCIVRLQVSVSVRLSQLGVYTAQIEGCQYPPQAKRTLETVSVFDGVQLHRHCKEHCPQVKEGTLLVPVPGGGQAHSSVQWGLNPFLPHIL